ncbi:MAG: alpha/beta fold hydrolase [Planctomycetes bacterium]|nr:alpha/beta fold hydrolase [Planctomycetota bacterium]
MGFPVTAESNTSASRSALLGRGRAELRVDARPGELALGGEPVQGLEVRPDSPGLRYAAGMRNSLSLAVALSLSLAHAASAERETLDTPVGRISYEVTGEGPGLVLIHDGLLPAESWDEVWGFFTARWRTLRYDRRGYGLSEPARGRYDDVADLAALLDHAGLARVTLVGSSAGGGLALDFALAHPQRVEALVLIGAVVSGGSYSEHFRARGLTNARPYRMEHDMAGTIERWVADPYFVAPASRAAKETLRRLLTAHPEPTLGTLPPPDEPPPALGRLGEIAAPVLLLVGEHDIPDVHAHAGMLEAGLKRAQRLVVEAAGHEVALEQPAAFERAVLEFLRPREVAEALWAELEPHSAGARAAAAGWLAYDGSQPLDAREKAPETRGHARLIDLDYASPHFGRVPAWLALPEAPGKHPALLFLHHGQGNRATFLDEMVALAEQGIVALSIDGTENRPDYRFTETPFFDLAATREDKAQLLTDLRRGLDLLEQRPEVDRARLGFVGHSLGATLGGVLVGIEPRIKVAVLVAGFSAESRVAERGPGRYALALRILATPEQRRAFLDGIAALDAVHYLRATRAALLFQFARRDEFIRPWDAELSQLATHEHPPLVQWFDCDHWMNEEVRKARDEWLRKVL